MLKPLMSFNGEERHSFMPSPWGGLRNRCDIPSSEACFPKSAKQKPPFLHLQTFYILPLVLTSLGEDLRVIKLVLRTHTEHLYFDLEFLFGL